MKKVLLHFVIFILFLCQTAWSQTIIGRQQAITLPTSPWASGITNALVWLPPDYSSSKTYPLIISLHGVGQVGALSPISNLSSLTSTSGSVAMYIANGFNAMAVNPADGKTYEYIVVSPQAPSWSYGESQLAYMLPQIEKMYSIDKARVYITGYSAGGWGTWTSLTDDTAFAKQIAAIAPMSAATLEPTRSPNVINAAKFGIAVWDIIQANDANGFTPSNVSYVSAINALNPKIPALITLIPGTGHSAWVEGCNPAWSDPADPNHLNLYQWFLQYTRGTSTSGTVVAPTTPSTTLRTPENPLNTVNGLNYRYFRGNWSVLPDFTTLSPVKSGSVLNYNLTPADTTAQFGFSFTGYINIPTDGQYTFYTSSDDGSRLLIGSTLVVDNDGLHALQEKSGTIGLKAGKHAITVNYFQQGGGSSLSVSYAGPGITKMPVPDSVLYRIPSANLPPVAHAGVDQTLTLPLDSTQLDGSLSTDPDGSITTYRWSLLNGPSQFLFTNSSSAKTQLSKLVAGTYTVELTVTDNLGASSVDSLKILVNPALVPIISAGNNISLSLPRDSALLSGKIIYPTTNPIAYSWSKSSGPSQFTLVQSNSLAAQVQNLTTGTYVFKLTATNTTNQASTADSITITVAPAASTQSPNQVACAGHSVIRPTIFGDATIHLDGTKSSILGGDTILLSSATRSVGYITMNDIYGSPGCPVVVTDDGNFWDTASNVSTNGLAITNCRFMKIIGSSQDTNHYSFHIDGSHFTVAAGRGGGGISVEGTSADVEIGYIDIENKDEGIIIKQEIACGDSLQYPNSIMHNFHVHHNKIKGMVAEGMYIGSTDPDNNITTAVRAHSVTCNGVVIYPLPLRMDSIWIDHNIVDSTGRSGIQVSGAETGRNQVDSNNITRCGYELNPSGQGCGISLGSYDNNFKVFGNRIFRTFTSGIQAFPIGATEIYNNWIDSSGMLDGHNSNSPAYGNVLQAGITMDTRPTYNPATYKTSFKIHDNFIGFNEDKGIRIYNTNNSFLTTNSICNNTGTVNVAPGVIWASCLSVGGWESNSQPGTPATTSVATPSSYIYPNPASNAVHVWLNDKMKGRIFLNIYDEQERLVQSKPVNKNASTLLETLNVSALSPGFYFLQIISESGKSILKFIKQ